MNIFRCTKDGSLDKQYLRTCAVYRLLKAGRIGKERAIELMRQRHISNAQGTVELWLAHPLKHLTQSGKAVA